MPRQSLGLILRAGLLLGAIACASGDLRPAAADPDLVPHSGVKFEKRKISALPPYVPRRLPNGDIEVLGRQEILAELVLATGLDLNERGAQPLPPPVPRLSCRFERYSAIDHRWMEKFVDWNLDEAERLDLSFREESWDCDDFSLSLNAMADLAMLRAAVHCPPQLIGRLIVNQARAWAGVPMGGAHELVIFRSEKQWWVVEPQNGKMISLWEYPNRQAVREILFN